MFLGPALFKAREKAEREQKIKEIEEARARVSLKKILEKTVFLFFSNQCPGPTRRHICLPSNHQGDGGGHNNARRLLEKPPRLEIRDLRRPVDFPPNM